MLQANSSPRGEAASSPHPRRTTFRKRSYTHILAVECTFLQIHAVSCSLLRILDVELASKGVGRSWVMKVPSQASCGVAANCLYTSVLCRSEES
jgi:hypothetical protein